jgi:hypothetical protein
MNLLARLLAYLRRPRPTPIAPVPAPVAALPEVHPIPKTPLSPPTAAERQAREPQRALWTEQLLLAEENKALAEGRVPDELPAYIRRLIIRTGFIKADQDTARENDWGAELLRLQMEEQELQATIKFEGWQHGLCKTHGEEIGRKLARHQLEPGMTMEHMVASFGVPATADITPHPTDESVMYVSYGSLSTGSHFELRDNIIARVQLGRAAFPDYVYNEQGIVEE